MSEKQTIEKLLRQQASLASFGSFAFLERDLSKVLTEAARSCAESLNVPFAKICRHRETENDLIVEAGHGWRSSTTSTPICSGWRFSPSSEMPRREWTG